MIEIAIVPNVDSHVLLNALSKCLGIVRNNLDATPVRNDLEQFIEGRNILPVTHQFCTPWTLDNHGAKVSWSSYDIYLAEPTPQLVDSDHGLWPFSYYISE